MHEWERMVLAEDAAWEAYKRLAEAVRKMQRTLPRKARITRQCDDWPLENASGPGNKGN
jgi:hypothetical protein